MGRRHLYAALPQQRAIASPSTVTAGAASAPAASCIGLADCNNFYASCETVFRPALAGRPVLVLSNNDGCVIARSRAAKRLGIAMGAPVHTIQHLIRRYNIVVCSANFALYGNLSHRVMDVLASYTPHFDMYSIDEGFLDLAHVLPNERMRHAAEIRAVVHRWTGIWVSLGIASTKTLAKAANERAKTMSSGVLVLPNEAQVNALLRRLPVEEVWGIGKQRANFLRQHRISTAYDFKLADSAWVKRHLYLPMLRTQMELRGVSCLALDEVRAAKQEICSSRSFGRPVRDLSELKEAVAQYATRVCEKARAQHSAATVLTVFISTNPFRIGSPQYSKHGTVTLARATNDTQEVTTSAHRMLERLYREGFAYHRAGVMLGGFVTDAYQQADLFATPPDPRREQLMRTMDAINRRFGRDTIRLLSVGNKQQWRMRQEHCSPHYVSRWDELVIAR